MKQIFLRLNGQFYRYSRLHHTNSILPVVNASVSHITTELRLFPTSHGCASCFTISGASCATSTTTLALLMSPFSDLTLSRSVYLPSAKAEVFHLYRHALNFGSVFGVPNGYHKLGTSPMPYSSQYSENSAPPCAADDFNTIEDNLARYICTDDFNSTEILLQCPLCINLRNKRCGRRECCVCIQ